MKNLLLVVALHIFIVQLPGQTTFPYQVTLVPKVINGLPGLQSYAYAQHNGKWLIVGGRKDGLHARQPFNSFPASQNNTDIYVVDIANNQFWSASVNSLPTGLREQLQSTNMNFYQDGNTLFIIGGYGYSASANDHITYPYLTSVDVPGLMNAIQNNQPILPYFKQMQDNIFAVTGGHLKKINNFFYLVGGHRFDGRYNPFGNPTFTQTYTNQIRKFTIDNSGSQLSYSNYTAITDPVHLRRRDYNLAPQIFPNGQMGLTIFSGVFQINADLPFLYPVDITENGYTPITSFNQYLSHYHSPVATMYDAQNNQMHTLFFGGMSQYYYQNGNLIQDNQVPFVKTISRVTRDANGNLYEYQLPVEMPGLKGASAEFIPNMSLPRFPNGVLKLNDITSSSFMIGHIYGGISSPLLNPFSNNQTNLTQADSSIYEVWLTSSTLGMDEHPINGKNPYSIEVYPNPFRDSFFVKFHLDKTTNVSYYITNNTGQLVKESCDETFHAGENEFKISLSEFRPKEVLYLTVVFNDKFYITKKLTKK